MGPFFHYPLLVFTKNVFSPKFDTPYSSIHLDSELGIELKRLGSNERERCLDPTIVKNIIVATEDTRIALRLSELESEYEDQIELQHQVELVNKLRLDLYSGQQCVKDFFVCLGENTLSWPEVCSSFFFKVYLG